MNRFNKQNKSLSLFQRLFFSIVIFMVFFVFFYYGISSVSQTSTAEEKQSLETALKHAVVHCYSTEGNYPESLDYLVEHYGITYDAAKFFIDYRPVAANIMPDITIISLEDPS